MKMEDRAISLNAVLEKAFTLKFKDMQYMTITEEFVNVKDIMQLPPATPQFIPIEGDGFEKTLPEEMDGCWALFTDGKQISIERWKLDAINHFYPGGKKFSFQEAKGYYPLPKMDLLKREQSEDKG